MRIAMSASRSRKSSLRLESENSCTIRTFGPLFPPAAPSEVAISQLHHRADRLRFQHSPGARDTISRQCTPAYHDRRHFLEPAGGAASLSRSAAGALAGTADAIHESSYRK